MSTGLSHREIEMIRGVLRAHPRIDGAWLFGSRAKGVARPSSDVDLALEGTIDALGAEAVARELDELPMPYRFDVHALAATRSPALREHIARVGIRIYGH